MGQIIKVGMADFKVGRGPDIVTTLGLGSCVGIALYDPVTKIGGLVHIMLPDSTKIRHNSNKAKFADTGIHQLIDEMKKLGAGESRLVAKLAGGAQMFEFNVTNEIGNIGQRNVVASKEILGKCNIRILAEDTGLNYGRTVELYCDTGDFLIKSVGKPIKTL
ncbi:chemotaxis protein CheD [Anaerosacchariphilus polymeriproducens]|uniref:Probable chemoreceptor glutamine deamidase CheD n=1 Tax=Anaerosacchariphilus polymeriproducens TaxID=1812858 RepID=A0A371AS66_9FIRM|nr:chemotaxis protein CheD [Anaerosacchariphilus polymeriproducens]RDU22408.1 chemotaxis protein CheD [Anaerosacchariphilus polymeriproducens]